MNQDYIRPDEWSIIEDGFDPERIKSSESLFSLGNGAMGQRANFEEYYSGPTFQGSYIAGVYYPDKTKVGWWKNGYPEYFAKVLNAPNWIGIDITVNGETLDLFTCTAVSDFRRELNMKEGWLSRSFTATLKNGTAIKVETKRFLSLSVDEVGAITYSIIPINKDAQITYSPYLDAGITNMDSNWDDKFWQITQISHENEKAFIEAYTLKTKFSTCTFMESVCYLNGAKLDLGPGIEKTDKKISFHYTADIEQHQIFTIHKFGGYTVDRNHERNQLITAANKALLKAMSLGFANLLEAQKISWARIWKTSDITITGDIRAQQGIRFNIYHLNQTYSGTDARLNIGPKGFTGEKYGGSTYWDTEAYCLPFYMATKGQTVGRNLLEYRYNHLKKAIENGAKLGFTNGAALYPMVTMNGEECHNEWEITFEEIHRNGAIAFAIYNYYRYTGDYSYIHQKGLEVLIAIAKFWHQRATYSTEKNKYVILGVTGPNEYENNINNNWYTNYIAQWCIHFTIETLDKVRDEYKNDYTRIYKKLDLTATEIEAWKTVADNMYFPFSEKHNVFLQQDGFLDKELITVAKLDKTQRPINQKWSWDRILRSPYIKQADTLQGFYFFEDKFSKAEIERHFDFYEPFTVHESSLSPCVHSVIAAKLDRMDQAYNFYLRTSRLDLDDYNKEVEEGLHITSMAGTWLSIVEGFGGMRISNDTLTFQPKIPEQWDAYSFKVIFRDRTLKVTVSQENSEFTLIEGDPLDILVDGKPITIVMDNIVRI